MSYNLHVAPVTTQNQQKPCAVFVEPNHVNEQTEYQKYYYFNDGYAKNQLNHEKYYNTPVYPDETVYVPSRTATSFYNHSISVQDVAYVPSDEVYTNSNSHAEFNFFQNVPIKNGLKNKDQILEEIVRECNEIEQLSNTSASPLSSWSSDEQNFDIKKNNHFKNPEKKERKKAQNRLAATRYRDKKRREKEAALINIEKLNGTNKKLREQIGELEQEIRYFKKFMCEMGMQNTKI